MGHVKVLRAWKSPFSWRVELALKLKGIEYEIVEEDLNNKSDQLLMYNPVHKKIPVLVHDGKAISESLVIMEYIDETWKDAGEPLLPSDPYERAHARFWAKFIDEKIYPPVRKGIVAEGEEKEKLSKEVQENLKILEKEVTGKNITSVGYLEIVGLFVAYWAPVLQESVDKKVITRESFPGLYNWADQLVGHKFMKENLPNREELLATFRARFAPSK